MNCKVCQTDTRLILDLGKQPLANSFLTKEDIPNEIFYRLQMVFCPWCYTVQLAEVPDKEQSFNTNYPFYTSTSTAMVEHFRKIAEDIKKRHLPLNGLIVEIGSNDGSFLKNFKSYRHLGIEPSGGVRQACSALGLNTCGEFFCEELAKKIVSEHGHADVVFSANVLPHMSERDSVLKGIKLLLSKDGVWINEEVSLERTIRAQAYDQFYNEHIFFSSRASMHKTARMYGMKLLDSTVDIPTHGGSLRMYITHSSNPVGREIDEHVRIKKGMDDWTYFYGLQHMIDLQRSGLLRKLNNCYKPVGYAATAKSATILNYCQIGPDTIDMIFDITPAKIGKLSPGMHIPVVDYAGFKSCGRKDVVLFAWNHAKEIFMKEQGRDLNWIYPI